MSSDRFDLVIVRQGAGGGFSDARFLRLLLLVDADITAGEGAGGITVAQLNRKSVRASGVGR
jgi:hypothetical protein